MKKGLFIYTLQMLVATVAVFALILWLFSDYYSFEEWSGEEETALNIEGYSSDLLYDALIEKEGVG
ncbi:hypothetical protein [Aerococcus kribbianus]|uniref:Uncharacterized protein n=1 Tax=Aerococcus kribbianus TaxID=2999064 RepID=A0A9X3JCU2_9LACT|nr:MULTISPECIES: hypothetical protein [unclassified Aerococcus]MCZ0716825.1 hypothetical protein [Aerococcus sp. YH-aer221]MCZ0725113.1 hypothetical protein [Aerococcus sp. YH-aer222]